MKYKDKISVIIPTYNRENTIKSAIESVLNQTYTNIEVIVVDDGSTDGTEKIVKKIKDKRLKYIKQKKNKGACAARNLGIEKATGQYISFQDSDDIYYKNKLELQYKNMQKENSDFDFCKLKLHDDDKIIIIPAQEQIDIMEKKSIIDSLCNGNFISTQTILIKSEILKKYNFDINLPRLQDYDFVLRIIPNCKVSFTNKCLVNLYIQNDSIGRNTKKLKEAIAIISSKTYNMTQDQKMKFVRSLNELFESKIKDEYIQKIEKIQQQNNELIDNLNKELDFYKKELNDIINSRTWRIKTKINNILGRK